MEFLDLTKQYLTVKRQFHKKLQDIMSKGDFILGEEVRLFEKEFAQFCKVKYAVGLNSGTDAILLSLKALGIGRGDEVVVPAFTFIATSFAVSFTGARPVFVDIDAKTYNIDPQKIEKAITKKTKAIVPVYLFGLCADMAQILNIARRHKLYVVEDAAQAHGAKINNKIAGSLGDLGCFSFYPTKNLSAFGDAGMITTNSNKLYNILLQLRDCGRSHKRYLHNILGYNSRLDNVQAAYLRLKLKQLNKWTDLRIKNANTYYRLLKDVRGLMVPVTPQGFRHVFHAYSIRTKIRKKLMQEFHRYKIPCSIFYPLPLHLQKANRYLGYRYGDFPVAEKVSKEILSIPVHPNLKKEDILKIVSVIKRVHNG
jgi:dTDP-4-amino-4,6-dideoxygalactose transaminase